MIVESKLSEGMRANIDNRLHHHHKQALPFILLVCNLKFATYLCSEKCYIIWPISFWLNSVLVSSQICLIAKNMLEYNHLFIPSSKTQLWQQWKSLFLSPVIQSFPMIDFPPDIAYLAHISETKTSCLYLPFLVTYIIITWSRQFVKSVWNNSHHTK